MNERQRHHLGRAEVNRTRAPTANPDAEPALGTLPTEIARELVPVPYDGKSPLAGRRDARHSHSRDTAG